MEELKPKRKGKYHHRGNQKHGLYNGNSSLFNTWQTMIGRCENPNREKYKDYGGRGIKVCSEWHQASNFVLWALSNGYKKGLQIDRIDNNGDYCPENCRFTTPSSEVKTQFERSVQMLYLLHERCGYALGFGCTHQKKIRNFGGLRQLRKPGRCKSRERKSYRGIYMHKY